ncbi:gamma-interferon-inducible lysosomal thiol reductase-like isoform X2 [Tachypleus tridentatus]|uniref:gamma-interferon-inducible lysosomal thiol reductase-like isoform X2 n=1 Tax=Tachypleus tridentatus TaxID=6853 RepID=UPI003FD1C8DB
MTEFSTVCCIFIIFSVLNSQLDAQPNKLVQVGVYYEALCPDSIDFIVEQLWLAYKKVRSIFEVDLVPYGKAWEKQLKNGTWVFQCQHGREECYGNLVQTCAVCLLNNTDLSLPFVHCAMSSSHPQSAGPMCARKLNIDYRPIEKCLTSDQGNRWQHEMGKKTESQKPHITFIPRVVINGVYSKLNQEKALRNFLGLVCENYKGPKPVECPAVKDDSL